MEGGSCSNSGSSCSSLMAFGDIINDSSNNINNNSASSSRGGGVGPQMMMMMMPFSISPNSSSIAAASAAASAPHPNITGIHNCHDLHAHSDTLNLPPPPTSSTTHDRHPHHHRYSAATACSFQHQLNQILHDQQHHTSPATGYYFMDTNTNLNSDASSVKARIMAHPHYPRLLAAYLNCQKVGAPAEVVTRLEEACTAVAMGGGGCIGNIGDDPALDQFMEAYCEMLSKYEQELTKPFKEAMLFLSRIESQFKAITLSSFSSVADHSAAVCGESADRNNGSSEDEVDANNFIDPLADEGDLKVQLLRKYSGYLGSLKQEFMKKRKKGKLPKEARLQLMQWWSRHYKWPYPSESQKLALAESTGLDQKQINNWFINQRKRHWKPSEDMQFVVMDAAHQHAHAHPHHHYLDAVLGNPSFPMDVSPSFL